MTIVNQPAGRLSSGTVLLLIAALVVLVMLMAVPAPPPKGPPPCPKMDSAQEATLRDYAQKLSPGGPFEGYPLLADRATRFAFLAQRGITEPFEAASFQTKASLVRQTAYEFARGECWEFGDKSTMDLLKIFVDLAKEGKL